MPDDPFQYIVDQLKVKTRRGDQVSAFCPAHNDVHKPSLSVSRGDEQPIVLHCHAGCQPEQIVEALGLSMHDLSDLTPRRTAVYYYENAIGDVLYSVERWTPKRFLPRLPDGNYQRPRAAEEVLYNLPNVLDAKNKGERVYLVEGERDVETLKEYGFTGTTAMSGANQAWLPQFSEQLSGARVTVVADNDEVGRSRARRIAGEVRPYCLSVSVMVPTYGKDVTDMLLAGYSVNALQPMPLNSTILAYSLADVEVRRVEWAWQNWIARGVLAIIEGDPGEGKSVLSVDLAARWTTGMRMPDGTDNPFGRPVRVGLVSAEDDPARAIKPRLLAAGGNPANIVYLEGVAEMGRQMARSIDFELDVDLVREIIQSEQLSIICFDPLMAFLGKTKTHVDAEVRRVLSPLRMVAEQTDCAILTVRHLRKGGGKPIHAGGGSIAFAGAARTVALVGLNPHEPNERLLTMTKSNVGITPASLRYRIVGDSIFGIGAAKVEWLGESELGSKDVAEFFTTSRHEARAEVAAELTQLLGIEDLDFLTLKKRLYANGVECSEYTLRSVLQDVAVQIRSGQGTQAYKVIYRLKSRAPQNLKPQVDFEQNEIANDSESIVNLEFCTGPPNAKNRDSLETTREFEEVSSEYEPEIFNNDQTRQESPNSELSTGESRPDKLTNDDLKLECAICGSIDRVVYYDDVSQWRCAFHNPFTFHAEAGQ
jgi:hypothetical protein